MYPLWFFLCISLAQIIHKKYATVLIYIVNINYCNELQALTLGLSQGERDGYLSPFVGTMVPRSGKVSGGRIEGNNKMFMNNPGYHFLIRADRINMYNAHRIQLDVCTRKVPVSVGNNIIVKRLTSCMNKPE